MSGSVECEGGKRYQDRRCPRSCLIKEEIRDGQGRVVAMMFRSSSQSSTCTVAHELLPIATHPMLVIRQLAELAELAARNAKLPDTCNENGI